MKMPRRKKEALDEIDYGIIRILLTHGGRTPLSDIAKQLGASIGTVKRRLENLIKSKVIQDIIPIVEPSLFGFHGSLILVRFKEPGAEKVLEILEKDPRVIFAAKVTGEYDLAFVFLFKDHAELSEFINSLLVTRIIERTSTFVILEWNVIRFKLPLKESKTS